MYDLNLIPVSIQDGRHQSQLVGFNAFALPRRTVRSRSEDQLIFMLTTGGADKISIELQQSWLERLSQIFYKTSGSVTSALRTLIETLNLNMLEKNLKDKSPTSGAINLIALHHQHCYIAQSGQIHAYTLTKQGLQHFFDTSQSDRGLGSTRAPIIRYFQANLGTGGYLFMSPTPPQTWTEDQLRYKNFPTLEQLRRRLLNQAPANFKMGLVQMNTGEGKINIFKSTSQEKHPPEKYPAEDQRKQTPTSTVLETESAEPALKEPLPSSEEADPIEQASPRDGGDTQKFEAPSKHDIPAGADPTTDFEVVQTSQAVSPARLQEEKNDPQPAKSDVLPPRENTNLSSQTIETRQHTTKKPFNLNKDQIKKRTLKGLVSVFDLWHSFRDKVATFFKDITARWTAKDSDSSPKLSRKTKLIIAVIVPIVVVAVAVGFYIVRGRNLQFEYYFGSAESAASTAINAEDPASARIAWGEALAYLDQAETYRSTNEISTLRSQANHALDTLDGAVRLRYVNALGTPLTTNTNITRIISYVYDLYLLDAETGRVLHFTGTDGGYKQVSEFTCLSRDIVDIVPLPPNNPYQAHILAVDSFGSIAYCAPQQDPVFQSLPTLPGVDGGIKRVAFDNNILYVLHPAAGTVLAYQPTNGQYSEAPTDYFEEADIGEKPDINQITDLEVAGAKLYLLRTDGALVECSRSGLPGDPLNCNNPVTYVDGRIGREDQPVEMPEASYSALLYNEAPQSIISVLDATNADIYQFSINVFRLNRRLRPNLGEYEISSSEATAFTISRSQVIFIAFGNQVFYANLQ